MNSLLSLDKSTLVPEERKRVGSITPVVTMDRGGYLETSYAGVVECCDGVVNPLILLGLIAGNTVHSTCSQLPFS